MLPELLVPGALGLSLTSLYHYCYDNGKFMNDFLLALSPASAHNLDEALASHAATLLYRHYSPRPMKDVQADFMQWLNTDKPTALADVESLEIHFQPTDDPAFCQFVLTCYLDKGSSMIRIQGQPQPFPLRKLQAEVREELRQHGESLVILR